MISDITLGQFFPGSSPIHRLDPRTKIIISVLFIATVFVANNPISFLALLVISAALIITTGISVKVIMKSLKPIIFIIAFTGLINLFMGQGEIIFEIGFIKITEQGIARAVLMALRVVFLILGSSLLLTYTTSPISMTDGLESLLSPLKKVKVPVHTFAMMMSIALRFIPTLIEETDKIMNAQKSRGADFTSGGLVKKAKALVPILIPLFVSSFKRAEELATAMECRCYRGDKNRTKLVKLEYHGLDFAYLIGFVIMLGIFICLSILPYKIDLGIPETINKLLFYKV